MAKNKKVLKVFIWKMYQTEDLPMLEQFIKLSVREGLNPTDKVTELITDYVNSQAVGFTIVSEVELLKYLADSDIKISRRTLKLWREKGKLKDKNENNLWFTDGHAICYNKEAVINIIQAKN